MTVLLVVALLLVALAPPAEAKTPSKLWYRSVVTFDGRLTRTITHDQAPPAPGAAEWERLKGPSVDEWRSRWELGSTNAAIVSRRSNGRANLAMRMAGTMLSFTHTQRFPGMKSYRYGVENDCQGWTDTGGPPGPVEMRGLAGRLDGLAFGSLGASGGFPAEEAMFIETPGHSQTCTTTWRGRTSTATSAPVSLRSACCYYPSFIDRGGELESTTIGQPMGTEPAMADKLIFAGRPPLTIKAGEYGKRVTRRFGVSHTYAVAKPGSSQTTRFDWSYNYRFTLYPCPRGGRRVDLC